jgi:hypothetical protein
LFVFVLGLVTFPYVTQRFLGYWGGELLLFTAAPWSLYAMRWAGHKPPIVCFTISLLSAALLFFAKLTGLVVFATNVLAISLTALVTQRRLDSSTMAMWVASAVAALCFMMFCRTRLVPWAVNVFLFWLQFGFRRWCCVLWNFRSRILHWFLEPLGEAYSFFEPSEVLGPLGLLPRVGRLRLRYTRYRMRPFCC